MGLASALAFRAAATGRNFVRVQVQRLRRPVQLIALLIAIAYFGWYSANMAAHTRRHPLSAGWAELLGVGAIILMPIVQWLVSPEGTGVALSEAEIHFLLPAPVRFRTLLHYKIGILYLQALAIGGGLGLIFGGAAPGGRLVAVFGLWIVMSALALASVIECSLRSALAPKSTPAWRRVSARLVPPALAAAALAALLSDPAVAKALVAGVPSAVLDMTPISWIAWPARAMVRLVLAPDGATSFRALPPALVLLGILHFAAVLAATSSVSAENALAAAEHRARVLARFKGGGGLALTAPVSRRRSAQLAATGGPEGALAWKWCVATRRTTRVQQIAFLTGIIVLLGTLKLLGHAPFMWMSGLLALATWPFAVIAAPAMLGTRLGRDRAEMDLLRTAPVRGIQVVLGECLAPCAVIVVVQWGLLAVAAAGDLRLGQYDRWIFITLAIVGPGAVAVGVVAQAALGVLFPGFVGTGPSMGPLALGFGILRFLVATLALTIAAIPVAAVAGPAGLVGFALVGPAALPLAGAIGAGLFAVEAWIGVHLVGLAWERSDPAAA